MAKKPEKNLIVGLDIGTSKIAALIGEIEQDEQINVIGFGYQSSRGIKRGQVVNIDSTVQAIRRAVEEAELMAGCQIHSAFTGITGNHIRGLNSHGIVAIKDREVNKQDIERVIDAAKAVAIPADQKILHILPQEFIIDNQEGIREPIGMSGVRLEARVHMVTGAVSAAQNIVTSVRRCNFDVADIILGQVASSYAVLNDDEKELGVCLVDIGGGSTDIAIFTNGAIRHTAVIPIAGDHVTNDIAVALRTPTQSADQIKIKYASCTLDDMDPDELIEVPSVGERPVRRLYRRDLVAVVEARYEELFGLVKTELRRSGFEDLIASGIVLTGGASSVKGTIDLAEKVFGTSVRIGFPQYVNGLNEVTNNPIYATGVGLLLYGQKQRGQYSIIYNQAGSLWSRMRGWFQGNF